MMFAQQELDDEERLGPGRTVMQGLADMDFISRTTRGTNDPLFTRHSPQVGGDIDFDPDLIELGAHITYSFPHTIRDNRFNSIDAPMWAGFIKSDTREKYGADNFSFRLLYEFLCRVYNSGEYFIDTYFEQDFKQSPVYPRYIAIRDKIRKEVARELWQNKKGLMERASTLRDLQGRFSSATDMTDADLRREYERLYGGTFKDFKVWRNSVYARELKDVGQEIREDIIVRLSTGNMTLIKDQVQEATVIKRAGLGLAPSQQQVFFASGQLIESLNVYISLDEREVA